MPRKTSKPAQTAPVALPFEPLPIVQNGGKTVQNAKRTSQNAKADFGDALTKTVQSVKPDQMVKNDEDVQDVDLVRKTLRAICADTAAPAAARAQAARTLAEMAHALGRNAPPPPPPSDKPLSQMTRAELEAELTRLGG